VTAARWIAALAVVAAASGCGGDGGRQADEAEPAPSYEAVTLDGEPVSLDALRGEVVLLNVWATWCAPCRREIPELQALHTAHRDEGLRVIGVTVDSRSAEEEIRRFVEEFGMTYEIWWDPDQVAVGTFAAAGVPLTVLIGRDGRIVWEHLGAFERGDPALIAAVDSALAVTRPAPPSSSR
jgi:cytochrome c biogenesis protein CcmG/thiol:disulfide interchange protein DsbE